MTFALMKLFSSSICSFNGGMVFNFHFTFRLWLTCLFAHFIPEFWNFLAVFYE